MIYRKPAWLEVRSYQKCPSLLSIPNQYPLFRRRLNIIHYIYGDDSPPDEFFASCHKNIFIFLT